MNVEKGSSKKRFIISILVTITIAFIFIILCGLLFGSKRTTENVKLTYSGASSSSSSGVQNMNAQANDWGISNKVNYNTVMTDEVTMESEVSSDSASNSYDYESDITPSETNLTDGKKLKKTYRYEVETTDYTNFITKLSTEVSYLGGYIESSNEVQRTEVNSSHTETYTVRQNSFQIRVPVEKVSDLLGLVDSYTYIVTKNEGVEDVTSQYLDLETHIKSLKEEYKILNDLLSQASTVTETIEIQDRLSSINYMIESYEKSLDLLKEDIEYSKIYLTVDEVIYYKDTVRRFTSDIAESWYDVFEGWISEVLPAIVLVSISLIPLFVIIGFAVYIISKIIMKNKSKYKQTVILESSREGDSNNE